MNFLYPLFLNHFCLFILLIIFDPIFYLPVFLNALFTVFGEWVTLTNII